MKNKLNLFIPFSKQDEDKKIVSGYASTEALDSDGEVVERGAIIKALPGYLGDFDKENSRFRFGNIREMHQSSAVGKTMSARVDKKGLLIDAKVVDDNAWKKVKEGVYAGFSIGGKVVHAVKNRIKSIRLSEISLVDRPANPEAIFAMVKINKSGKAIDLQKGSDSMEIQNEEVLAAGAVIDLAREIRMFISIFEVEGRSITELQKALNLLKKLAAKILNEEDKKKFEKVLYEMRHEEIEKSLYREQHVVEKKKVEKLSKSDKEILKVTGEIKNHINKNWTPGYFDQLREILG